MSIGYFFSPFGILPHQTPMMLSTYLLDLEDSKLNGCVEKLNESPCKNNLKLINESKVVILW